MKLNNLIYGVLTIFAFSSCADQMEYSEYNPYDAGYVKRTFYDVGGLVSNIYQSLDSDFGNYSGVINADYLVTFLNNPVEYLLSWFTCKRIHLRS